MRADTRPCGHPYGEVSLSKAGHCTRALAFALSGHEGGAFSDLARARMDLGFRYEALILEMLEREEGVTVSDRQRCVELDGVLGHIDAIGTWPDGRVQLIEVKSGSRHSVEDFLRGGLQYARSVFVRQHHAQVQAYLAALQLEEAAVFYTERAEGEAETIAALREAEGPDAPDPLDAWPVQLVRTERQVLQRSASACEAIAARLRQAKAYGAPGAIPPAALREHQLREDGTLQPPCGWVSKDKTDEGCDYRELCWGPLVQVTRKSKGTGLMPASETDW